LDRDLSTKAGQIAHVDRNSGNNNLDNLVYLCLEHHDEYDRPASQSKRFQPTEIRAFRDYLVATLKVAQIADPVTVLTKCLKLTRSQELALRAGLMQTGVPQELREAISAFSSMIAGDAEGLRNTYRSSTLLVSEVAYTHFQDSLKAEQEAIKSAIQRCCGNDVKALQDGGFQRVIQEQIARTNKVLCVFPFFLLPSRRHAWGVLPFGWQTSVAVVLHRDHPAAIEWNENESKTSRIATDPTAFPSPQTLEWLERLILHTEALNGSALWVQGYVQFEILLETAQRRGDNRIAAALVRTNSPVETLAVATDRLREYRGSYFAIDPAEIRTVCKRLDDEFQVVICGHDVHIPVGVGFSLPCSVMLLLEDRWRLILDVARQQYMPFAEDFERLGIRFENWIT
jgi:hypothetical protein